MVEPISLFFQKRSVNTASLEVELLGRKGPWEQHPNGDIVLTSEVARRGLRLDFCTVEWFDLAATAHLVALSEAALREGASVEIVPPFGDVRANERAWLARKPGKTLVAQLHTRIERRKRAASVFEWLEFTRCVQDAAARYGVRQRVVVRPGLDTSGGPASDPDDTFDVSDTEPDAATEHGRRRRLRRMSALRWLTLEQQDEVREFAEEIADLLLDPERAGIHPVDVRALTNAVFYELLQNVAVHAGSTQHAVVVAWIRPSSETIPPRAHLPHEQPYIEWVRTLRTPLLDLVIADSGDGANRSLKDAFDRRSRQDANIAALPQGDARVLAWAWDRWSSRFDEVRGGTRGLYRVDRVARRHHGLAMLRAGTQSVGWDHGGAGHDRLIASTTPLSPVPGTVVRLLLPTLPVEEAPVRLSGGQPLADVTVRWLHLRAAPVGGLAREQTDMLASAASPADPGRTVCVVVQCDPAPADANLLKGVITLSQHSHPATLVVFGLSDDAAALRDAVEASQHEAELRELIDDARGPEETDVGSPVLVVLPDGGTVWGGVPPWFARVLDRLLAQPDMPVSAQELEELIPDAAGRRVIYRSLRDTALAVTDGERRVIARVSLANLVAELRARLKGVVQGQVSRGRLYRTPTLQLTRAWVSPTELWTSTGGDHPALFALAALVRDGVPAEDLKSARLVIDANTQLSTGTRLRRYLHCADFVRLPHYAELAIPPGEPLLPQPGTAVVYCDVISSGESVLRSLKQVMREGTRPLAVLCVVDGRSEPGETVRVLGRQVPVFSLVQGVPLLADPAASAEDAKRDASTVSPLTGEAERPEETCRPSAGSGEGEAAEGPGSEIIAELVAAKGLHFTHIARPNGRHFTLWVDTLKLVALESVRRQMKSAVDAWLSEAAAGQPRQFAIWYPATRGTDNYALQQLAEWLGAQYHPRCRVVPVGRSAAYGRWLFPTAPEIGRGLAMTVIIDSSSVEGGTVSNLVRLAAECGTGAILVCMPLCQLPTEHRALLEGVMQVRVDALPQEPELELELELEVGAPQRVPHVADVRIRYLSQLLSSPYTFQACPVCMQRRVIGAFHPNNPAMEELRSDTADERLRPRDIRELERNDPEGILGSPIGDQELLAILEWRARLLGALTITRCRWELLAEVERIATPEATEEMRVSRRALLHLLVVESQWLALPPLEFAILRDRVGELARLVVGNRSEEDAARLHAIIAWRLAHTHRFVEQIEQVLAAVAGNPLLEEQALFSLYTFSERPFHPVPGLLDALVETLRRLRERIESQEFYLASPAASTLLTFLWGRAKAKRIEARSRWLTPQLAVDALRKSLSDVPQFVRRTFEEMKPSWSGNLRVVVEDQMRAGTSRDLSAYAESWLHKLPARTEVLRQWVREHLVTYLRPLEALLHQSESGLGNQVAERLVRIIVDTARREAPDNDRLFEAAASIAEGQDIPEKGSWQEYVAAYEWWERNIFVSSEANPPLVAWLRSFPAHLPAVVERLKLRMQSEERLCEVDPARAVERLPALFAPQTYVEHVVEDFVWDLVREIPNDGRTIELRLAPGRQDGKYVQFRLFVAIEPQVEAQPADEGGLTNKSGALDRVMPRLECIGAKVVADRDPERDEWSYLFSFEAP